MQYHRLSFPEAVQELARRYGIPLSLKDLGPEGAQQAKKRTKAYEANAAAAAFYAATLASSEGKPGRDYLAKRGLTPEVIRAFQLGYAVDEWDTLSRHFQNRGISLELAQEVGFWCPGTGAAFMTASANASCSPSSTGRAGSSPSAAASWATASPSTSTPRRVLCTPRGAVLWAASGGRGPAGHRRGPGGGGLPRPHCVPGQRHRQCSRYPRHGPDPGAGTAVEVRSGKSSTGL